MWIIGLAFAGDVCTVYGSTEAAVEVGALEEPIQASGIAAARGEDDLYYIHDDNGGAAGLYMVSGTGEYLGYQELQGEGLVNEDWEDIAPGPCPDAVDAEHCLWIGDIGDNDKDRPNIDVWVVRESRGVSETAAHCILVYPEGKKRDAEALFVDPAGALRIVTKDNDGAKVFVLTDPQCDGATTQTLVEETELVLDEKVTGAAMNADGTAVVLRGLLKAWSWTGCSLWSGPPEELSLTVEPQGEAVTFANDGALVTTSEIFSDEPLRLWRTPCAETAPVTCPEAPCGCGDSAALLLLLPLGGLLRRRRRA